MKRILFFCLSFLLGAMVLPSYGKTLGDTSLSTSTQIKTLIINADVSVLLVDDTNAKNEIIGNSKLNRFVEFKTSGDTVFINAKANKYLVNDGKIYVAASSLRKIHINSNAVVRSFYMLRIPILDVVINGSCYFSIANAGKVNMLDSKDYAFEYDNDFYRLPLNMPSKPSSSK